MTSLPLRCAARCSLLLAIVVLAACGREPVVRFSDYARYQRDNVTTRWVPTGGPADARLLAEGWRIDDAEGGSALRMSHGQARVWFFSHDDSTTGAKLRRGPSQPAPGLAISYRVNDHRQGTYRWQEGARELELPFSRGVTREGWNALDLRIVGEAETEEPPGLALAGIAFQIAGDAADAGSWPRQLTVADDELRMPGGSFVDVVFEVPERGRLRVKAEHESERRQTGSLEVGLEILDSAGAVQMLAGFRLDPGDTDRLNADLEPWAEQTVSVRLTVRGHPGAVARFRTAEVTGGGDRQPAEPPIRVAKPPLSGRLGRPDILVIVLDAARADAFGSYGARYPTPAVDTLAAAGTRFARAQSPSSWTGQSIPSLLTGFYPDTLHVERWGDPLPERAPSLAEIAERAGYRTVLWSHHPIYGRASSLVRGFQEVRYTGRRKRSKLPSASVLFEPGRPTFALIHLLPPHTPYTPPAPFRGAYTAEYDGGVPSKLGALGELGGKRRIELTARDRAYIRNRYLENVAFADSLVGRLLETLAASGRAERAMVIVTSDHGEAFSEHGLYMHSRELYQEFVHIPLVIRWPASLASFASVVERPVSLVDIVPTLVDGLGVEVEGGFQGESLLPAVFDGAVLDRALYAATRGSGHVTRVARPRWMLEDGSLRVIHDPVAGRTELYAVDEDRAETRDLTPVEPSVARLWLQRLLIQRSFNLDLLRLGPQSERELDPELLKELKALGYL